MIPIRHAPFEGGTKIELLIDDKPVSNLSVFDLRMRIGDVAVRLGGIGDVQTSREYRLKGHARRLLEDSVFFMREQGYHLAALFGITDFYSKFGFASALVQVEASVATRDAEAAVARYELREFHREDAQPVAEIYEAMHGQRTASIVRDPATWKGFSKGTRWSDQVAGFVAVSQGRVIGYASYDLDPWRCALGEIGYRDPSAFSTLLAGAAKLALERRAECISIHTPPDDPFLVYCRRYGCETKITYSRCARGMARIINQRKLLGSLQPLFTRRLRAAGREGWSGVLVFQTDLGEDRLCFGASDKELHVQMPQWMLGQLLLGYRSVADTLFETEARVDEEAVPILEVLFPQGYPYIWVSDRF